MKHWIYVSSWTSDAELSFRFAASNSAVKEKLMGDFSCTALLQSETLYLNFIYMCICVYLHIYTHIFMFLCISIYTCIFYISYSVLQLDFQSNGFYLFKIPPVPQRCGVYPVCRKLWFAMAGVGNYADTVWHCKSTASSPLPLSNVFKMYFGHVPSALSSLTKEKNECCRETMSLVFYISRISPSPRVLFFSEVSSSPLKFPTFLAASLPLSPQSRVTPPTLIWFACLSSSFISCSVDILGFQ